MALQILFFGHSGLQSSLPVRRDPLSIRENNRTRSYTCEYVGKDSALEELYQGVGANRPRADILAQLSHSQMQAARDKNNTVSHQNETAQITATVGIFL